MNQRLQVKYNFVSNIINLIVNVIIGILYTPYLVTSLGIYAYGIVPLALIINQYINVLTNSLTGSLTRFYSIAIQNHDINQANKYLSTSLTTIFSLIFISIPIVTILISNIDSVFTIPKNLIVDAKVLFSFSIIGLYLSLLSSILNITLYALNRLDIINITNVLRALFKFVFVIILFENINYDIKFIGYVSTVTEITVLICSIGLFFHFRPAGILIRIKSFSKDVLISVLSMAGWVLLHQIGDLGLYRTDNFMVNIFWTSKESGILAALSEFGNYVMFIITVISSLAGPLILIAYAKDDHEQVKNLTINTSLLVGVIAALITGILIGYSKPLIRFWLGAEFVNYYLWFIIKLAIIPLFAAAGVYAFTYRAWNKVKFPAIFTIVIGLINIVASYIIYSIFREHNNVITYVLIFSSLLIIIQSYGLNSFWFNHLYKKNGTTIIYSFLKIILALVISTTLSILTHYFHKVDSLVSLFAMMIISGLLSILVYWISLFNHREKGIVLQLINVSLINKGKR